LNPYSHGNEMIYIFLSKIQGRKKIQLSRGPVSFQLLPLKYNYYLPAQ